MESKEVLNKYGVKKNQKTRMGSRRIRKQEWGHEGAQKKNGVKKNSRTRMGSRRISEQEWGQEETQNKNEAKKKLGTKMGSRRISEQEWGPRSKHTIHASSLIHSLTRTFLQTKAQSTYQSQSRPSWLAPSEVSRGLGPDSWHQ